MKSVPSASLHLRGDFGAAMRALARTGFDAWVLALIGGVSVAGGLGLLAAQRRGRLSA